MGSVMGLIGLTFIFTFLWGLLTGPTPEEVRKKLERKPPPSIILGILISGTMWFFIVAVVMVVWRGV